MRRFILCILLFIVMMMNRLETIHGQSTLDDLYIVPIPKVIIQEYGTITLTPQVYNFKSITNLQYSYVMNDGSSLISGMSFNSISGIFTFHSLNSGEFNIIRNVSYINSDNILTCISHPINIQVIPITQSNTSLPLLFSDDFKNGNLSKWNLENGKIGIISQQLYLYQNNTLVTTSSLFDTQNDGITFSFNLLSSWTAIRGIVLFLDLNNYYEINLSNSPLQINRVLNGKSTILLSSTKLLQIHASPYYSSYKIHMKWTLFGIYINLGKMGIYGNDYALSIFDQDSMAIQKFKNIKFGFFDKGTTKPTQSFYKVLLLNIYQGKLNHDRKGQTYHVNQLNGLDSNNGLSQLTPLKTINAALNLLLPDDTLIIGDGIYRESILLNRLISNNNHPITIKALNQPIISQSSQYSVSYQHSSIIDGSLIIDNSKLVKVINSPISVYKYEMKYTPEFVYVNGIKQSLAMKPIPKDLQDEYYTGNYIHPKNASTNSNGILYLILDDMFKYDASGNQVSDDFWVGGILYHYYLQANVVLTRKIQSYNASTNTIGVSYLQSNSWGNLDILTSDYYAIGNHIGCFSMDGQYIANDNTIHLSSSNNNNFTIHSMIEVSALTFGVKLTNGMEGIKMEGLLIRKFADYGIVCSSYCSNIEMLNCSIKATGNSGVSFTGSNTILIDGGEVSENQNNGISFGGGMKDSIIQNMYIHHNINNGIWVGNGGKDLFYCWNILIKSNRVGPHYSQRLHPDNIQLASSNNVTLDSNILIQRNSDGNIGNSGSIVGDQNMWMEQNGLVSFIRNIFINGPVGINHAQSINMFNNVFYQSWMRFALNYENYVNYSSLVGLQSIADWKEMFNSITKPTIIGNTLIWSKNIQLVSKIQSYNDHTLMTSNDKNEIIDFINTIINDTNFVKQHFNILPLLEKSNVAYPYWLAISKRGLLNSTTGEFINSDIKSLIEEVRGLTRGILDELVFDGIIYKAMITFYPRNVNFKNNAFLSTNIQLPNSSYSILPYWETDYNYIEQTNNYQNTFWIQLAKKNTIYEKSLTNTTFYFKNFTNLNFELNCNSNISLIDKGINVGLSYIGNSPDIGVFEMNCNANVGFLNRKLIITSSAVTNMVVLTITQFILSILILFKY